MNPFNPFSSIHRAILSGIMEVNEPYFINVPDHDYIDAYINDANGSFRELLQFKLYDSSLSAQAAPPKRRDRDRHRSRSRMAKESRRRNR